VEERIRRCRSIVVVFRDEVLLDLSSSRNKRPAECALDEILDAVDSRVAEKRQLRSRTIRRIVQATPHLKGICYRWLRDILGLCERAPVAQSKSTLACRAR